MNSALAVSPSKECAAKRQQVIFLPNIFLHRMPFLLKSPVKAVVSLELVQEQVRHNEISGQRFRDHQ